jgi:hypothetical protein
LRLAVGADRRQARIHERAQVGADALEAVKRLELRAGELGGERLRRVRQDARTLNERVAEHPPDKRGHLARRQVLRARWTPAAIAPDALDELGVRRRARLEPGRR